MSIEQKLRNVGKLFLSDEIDTRQVSYRKEFERLIDK